MGKTEGIDCEATVRVSGETVDLGAGADLALAREVHWNAALRKYMVTVLINDEEIELPIDMSTEPVQVTAPKETDPAVISAAVAAAIGENAKALSDGSDAELELGEILSEITDLDPASPEYAERMERVDELTGQIMSGLDPAEVTHAEITPAEVEPRVSRRVAAKRRLEALGEQISDVMETPYGSENPEIGLLHEVSEVDKIAAQREERRAAAITLGGEIEDDGHVSNIPRPRVTRQRVETGETDENGNPITKIEFGGDLVMSETFMDGTNLWKSRVVNGGVRLVVYKGPPSTGKDTHVEEMCAALGLPLVTRNAGPNYDIQDMLGGEGVGPVTTYDDDGNPTGSGFGSKKLVGSLLEASQHPCCYVITEPEGIEDDFPRLNTLFGAKVGKPEERSVSAGSISDDDEINPHPDFMVAITYNPGHQDIKLPSSVHNRALNLSFEYPEEEEEYKIVAKTAKSIFEDEPGTFKDHEPDPKDVKGCVDLVRRLRQNHRTNPTSWIDQPDMRQAAYLYNDLVRAGKRGASQEDALRLVRKSLDFCQPGSMRVDPEIRARDLDDIVQDYATELLTICQKGQEMGMGATKPKAKAKKTTKTKGA